jgi:PAS domain S-box-containing protein
VKRVVSNVSGPQAGWSLLTCEENFRTLYELSNDAILIHQKGKCILVNPAGMRLFGATDASDIIGRPVLDLVHPDYREFVRNRIELSYHLRRVLPFQDERILRVDGMAVTVEAASAPVVLGGRPATLVILHDISGRRKQEAALRERERQLHTIFNTPNVFLAILEDHGSDILIITANAELSALYHSKPEAVSGRLVSQLGEPAEVIQEHLRHYDAARRQGGPHSWEYHRTWDGRSKWYSATASYIGRSPDGHHRFTFLAHDVTERKLTEEALQRSEAEFRGMFELSSVGMAQADPSNGRFLRVNRRFCDITGYPEAELLARTFRDITHPDDLDVDAARWESVVRGEADVWYSEKRYVRRDGSVIWVAVNGTCLRDAGRTPYRTMAVIQDITGRKKTEEALQSSHDDLERRVRERTEQLQEAYARIAMVLESVTVGFIAVDKDFRLTYVNNEITRMSGRERKDLLGRTLWEAAPKVRGTIFEEQYRKAIAEKTPVSFEAQSPVSGRWLEVKAFPSEEGLYIFVHDITERRKAEEERIRLESAISSAAEMVVITDHRGMIQYVNPAFERITGYSRAEALGGTMHILDSGKHDEEFYRELRGRLRRDRSWEGRLFSRKKDGTLFIEDCTLSLVIGMAGDVRNYVSVRRDVTDRLRFESIAESVETMNNLGYIFSGVRHEIGNPVNTAKMILTVLQQKLDMSTKEDVANYVARAMGEIDRVENLLKNLRNFNLYETQEPEVMMIEPFLASFLRLVTEDLAKKGIALTHRVGPGASEITADPRALQQVLLNLVTNAADAVTGREDAHIDIEVTADPGAAHLRITDNGRGMSEEEQKNLFRPFYTTKAGGTGLGLVIVRKMLAQMGGTIEITSRRESGTLVEISLVGRRNVATV